MARDSRRLLPPREQAGQDMAEARELIASGALSAGERAVAYAGLAQAAMLTLVSGQLASIEDALRNGVLHVDAANSSDIRELKSAMEKLAISGYDNRASR